MSHSISNTEFLSHDYDARGLDPEYRVATKNGESCYEWGLSFEYAKSVAEDIGGVVQKRFITEPKTITDDPDDRHKLSAQMALVEAMLAELPLIGMVTVIISSWGIRFSAVKRSTVWAQPLSSRRRSRGLSWSVMFWPRCFTSMSTTNSIPLISF